MEHNLNGNRRDLRIRREVPTNVSLRNKGRQKRPVLSEVTNKPIKESTYINQNTSKQNIAQNHKNDFNTKRISVSILKIRDIDQENEANIFLVTEYVSDIYKYLRHLESKYVIPKDYLSERPVTEKIRAMVIDWLVDVHLQFNLLQETLHLSVSIIDSYISRSQNVKKSETQLIGIASMFIACKYEESKPPGLRDFVYICDSAFNKTQILEMEFCILKALDFCVARSTSINFVRRYNMAANSTRLEYTYSKYFIDLALVNYSLCYIKPSLIAASAVYITKCISNSKVDQKLWTNTMNYYSNYKYSDFAHIIPKMVQMIRNIPNTKLTAVTRKYSSEELYKVSLMDSVNTSSNILSKLIGQPAKK